MGQAASQRGGGGHQGSLFGGSKSGGLGTWARGTPVIHGFTYSSAPVSKEEAAGAYNNQRIQKPGSSEARVDTGYPDATGNAGALPFCTGRGLGRRGPSRTGRPGLGRRLGRSKCALWHFRISVPNPTPPTCGRWMDRSRRGPQHQGSSLPRARHRAPPDGRKPSDG